MNERRSIFDTFVDRLDQFADAAIKDRFGEDGREQSEGPTEFANPHTVSQPVHPSQLPSGQPLNGVNRLGLSTTQLALAGSAVVVVLLLVVLVVRK
ncbi:MAG: hypothetical protein KTR20_15170 [Cellvibrionaceae bacterium]|nr:hypothetical protein [Cellvibrionaceae bacterium]